MAFCKNCGMKNEDGDEFCKGCGTSLLEDEAPAPAAKPAVNKSLPIMIGAGVAAVLVLVLIINVLGSLFGGYEKTAKKFMQSYINGDGKTIVNLLPDDLVETYCDNRDCDEDEMVDDINDTLEDMIDTLDDQYDKDWSVKFKVDSSKKLRENKVEEIVDYYDNNMDIDLDVDTIYEVKLKATAKFEDNEDTETIKIPVMKVDGKWRVDIRHIEGAGISLF